LAPVIMAEIKRAQISMENVALLSQVRTSPNVVPCATLRVPNLVFLECNDLFANALEYSNAQELLASQITMYDIVHATVRPLLQRRATKFMHKRDPKIVRTCLLLTRLGNTKCCSIVIMPSGPTCKMYILRQSTGIPERAARKLECIAALHYAKNKKVNLTDGY
jgi:hypothetical protein